MSYDQYDPSFDTHAGSSYVSDAARKYRPTIEYVAFHKYSNATPSVRHLDGKELVAKFLELGKELKIKDDYACMMNEDDFLYNINDRCNRDMFIKIVQKRQRQLK